MSLLYRFLEQSLSWAAVIITTTIESRAYDVVSRIDNLGKVACSICHGVGSLAKSAGGRKMPTLTVGNVSTKPCKLVLVRLINS